MYEIIIPTDKAVGIGIQVLKIADDVVFRVANFIAYAVLFGFWGRELGRPEEEAFLVVFLSTAFFKESAKIGRASCRERV